MFHFWCPFNKQKNKLWGIAKRDFYTNKINETIFDIYT